MKWKAIENGILKIMYFEYFFSLSGASWCFPIISNIKLIELGHILLTTVHFFATIYSIYLFSCLSCVFSWAQNQ